MNVQSSYTTSFYPGFAYPPNFNEGDLLAGICQSFIHDWMNFGMCNAQVHNSLMFLLIWCSNRDWGKNIECCYSLCCCWCKSNLQFVARVDYQMHEWIASSEITVAWKLPKIAQFTRSILAQWDFCFLLFSRNDWWDFFCQFSNTKNAKVMSLLRVECWKPETLF